MIPPATPPAPSSVLRQDWSAYSAEQHAVWRELYRRRMTTLERSASRAWLDGAEAIGLRPDLVPNLDEVNARLAPMTGWQVVPVDGFLPAREFFAMLGERRFPSTITVRCREELEYTRAPDIFHDVFGHVPMHADPVFADFLARFGRQASLAPPERVTAYQRLFWFTVEFGLVAEAGEVRMYGSGLISSIAEERHALGGECRRERFTLPGVTGLDFRIDTVQPVLFVVQDPRELEDALALMARADSTAA